MSGKKRRGFSLHVDYIRFFVHFDGGKQTLVDLMTWRPGAGVSGDLPHAPIKSPKFIK